MSGPEFRASLAPVQRVTVETSFGPLVFPMRMVDVRQGVTVVDSFPCLDDPADFDKVSLEHGWIRAGYDPATGDVILSRYMPALPAPPPQPAVRATAPGASVFTSCLTIVWSLLVIGVLGVGLVFMVFLFL